MTCEQIQATEVMERYVRQELDETEQAAFELHYFACPECFEHVRTVIGVHEALGGGSRRRRPGIRAGWYTGAAAAAVLLTAGSVFWLLRPDPGTRIAPVQSAVRPPSVSQPRASGSPDEGTLKVPSEARQFELLARIEAPAYAPPVLRGPGPEGEDSLKAAMKLYASRSFKAAIPALRSAVGSTTGARQLTAEFYLAICELVEQRPREAVATLERLISAGDSPYAGEAHFYMAKAYLQMNRPADAERELRRAIELGDGMETEARQLLRDLRKAHSGASR